MVESLCEGSVLVIPEKATILVSVDTPILMRRSNVKIVAEQGLNVTFAWSVREY